jgi:predicted  nucleic acid-binding Zn-ribbon protein
MKSGMVLLAFLALASTTHASGVSSPVSKVFEMLASLQAKIIKEGEEAQKAYDEFSEWCEDRHTNVGFEIKTGKAEVEDLGASIEKETSKASALDTKIEELSGSIAKDEADLSAATGIRNQEAADFAAEEKESKDVISTLERAIAVLSRKAAGGAAMIQFKNSGDIVQALTAMVQGSMLSSSDASRLTALVQNKQDSEEEDTGAPDPAAYKGHGDGIIGALEDLLEKAEAQLETARKTEQSNKNNYDMLKQSLEDQLANENEDMAEAKKGLAASQEAKATAEGDLSVTTAYLA